VFWSMGSQNTPQINFNRQLIHYEPHQVLRHRRIKTGYSWISSLWFLSMVWLLWQYLPVTLIGYSRIATLHPPISCDDFHLRSLFKSQSFRIAQTVVCIPTVYTDHGSLILSCIVPSVPIVLCIKQQQYSLCGRSIYSNKEMNFNRFFSTSRDLNHKLIFHRQNRPPMIIYLSPRCLRNINCRSTLYTKTFLWYKTKKELYSPTKCDVFQQPLYGMKIALSFLVL
jgi:hypothetical protein